MLSIWIKQKLTEYPFFHDISKKLYRLSGRKPPLYRFLAEFNALFPTAQFLQLGSNDGISNDPLREFIIQRQWSGILVEPIPYIFEKLKKNYAGNRLLKFENKAISKEDATLDFWTIDPEYATGEYYKSCQLSSFDREHLSRQLDHFYPNLTKDAIVKIKIPCASIPSLLEVHKVESLDLLHLDVEGFETELLMNFAFETHAPKAIIFESDHMPDTQKTLYLYLHNKGYEIFETDFDAIAVKRDLAMKWKQDHASIAAKIG